MDLFWGTSGPKDAEIAVVGESWGVNEDAKKIPFVGNTGLELEKLLKEAINVSKDDVFCTNVISAHPCNNNMAEFFYPTKEAKHPALRKLYPRQIIFDHLQRLYEQLKTVNPKIIIGLGNYTLWALTEDCFSIDNTEGYKTPSGITDWGGSQFRTPFANNIPFLPTFHPAAIFNTWPWRYIIVHDLRARVPLALEGSWDHPKVNFTIRPTAEQVLEFLKEFKKGAVDIETYAGHIACIALASSRENAICIPFISKGKHYWTEEEEVIIVTALRKCLSEAEIWGQNYLYDAQYIMADLFVRTDATRDTMLMHHTFFPGGGDPYILEGRKREPALGIVRKGLGQLSRFYCDHHEYWKEDGKTWNVRGDEEQLWTYNCRDGIKTYEIAEYLYELLKRFNLLEQADFQHRQAVMALNMMLRGILINEERRFEVAKELKLTIEAMEKQLDSLVPEDVYPRKPKAKPWYSSAKQQMEIFYDILGIKAVKHPKSKRPTLNAAAIPIIMNREPCIRPILEKIDRLRSIKVYYSTFTQSELDPDHRMRSSFSVSGTETFRWSSSENPFGRGGNIQNIPKGEEE